MLRFLKIQNHGHRIKARAPLEKISDNSEIRSQTFIFEKSIDDVKCSIVCEVSSYYPELCELGNTMSVCVMISKLTQASFKRLHKVSIF